MTASSSSQSLRGWGGTAVQGRELLSENLAQACMEASLSRGLARSYGDASLPAASHPVALNTCRANRILAWDPHRGELCAEAGLDLQSINQLWLPQGWFIPVSPGTQYVTLGGMVAADVHGKNHHIEGCIGAHVHSLRMRVADGRILVCDRERHPELFRATLGGMGLTGHILDVILHMQRIPSPWIWSRSYRIADIDAFEEALAESAGQWPYTMGWIDCVARGKAMGRGILMAGRWATADEAPAQAPPHLTRITMPFRLPNLALNRFSIRAFNTLYYGKHPRRPREGIVHPQRFFYPLDAIHQWNRMYGSAGFTQYQCVLPRDAKAGAARRLLDTLTRHGGASFLCVIKDCGPEGEGMLSFPRAGISIALDIPMRSSTQALVDTLNRQVIDEGGRIYLAKDALTRPEHFRAMEPRLPAFNALRDAWDPQRKIRSALSVRLLGDPA